MDAPLLRTVAATRYVTPLREGGSLPAIVEADDDGLYVLKFRGAGQGARALVAELVAGEIARAAGLPVPEIVFVELDGELARTEPDAEIQDLIRASAGLNVALDYLPAALAFDAVVHPVDADFASAVVWFDAFVTNPDRTARNTNLLVWHHKPWLIDHGAALYFHHAWGDEPPAATAEVAANPFQRVRDHVLLPFASRLAEADARLGALLTAATFERIVALVPDAWLAGAGGPVAQRRAYVEILSQRLRAPRAFAEEALRARAAHV